MYVSEPLTFLVLAKGTDLKFIIHNYIYDIKGIVVQF